MPVAQSVYNLILESFRSYQSSRTMRASDWAVSSVVEHCLHTAGVTSSKLVPPTKKINKIKSLKIQIVPACCVYGFCTDIHQAAWWSRKTWAINPLLNTFMPPHGPKSNYTPGVEAPVHRVALTLRDKQKSNYVDWLARTNGKMNGLGMTKCLCLLST